MNLLWLTCLTKADHAYILQATCVTARPLLSSAISNIKFACWLHLCVYVFVYIFVRQFSNFCHYKRYFFAQHYCCGHKCIAVVCLLCYILYLCVLVLSHIYLRLWFLQQNSFKLGALKMIYWCTSYVLGAVRILYGYEHQPVRTQIIFTYIISYRVYTRMTFFLFA